MKQVVIFLLTIYKVILSPILHQLGIGARCRYQETCSAYTTRQVKEKGVIKGLMLGVKRLATCHPFAKYPGEKV